MAGSEPTNLPAHSQMDGSSLAKLPFAQAFDIWLREHSRYISPSTLRTYNCTRKPLLAFFGEKGTADIRVEDIRQFQDERKARAGNTKINFEMSTLQQILKEADCWEFLAKRNKPLPISKAGSGHSLSVEEEERLREIAATKPKWRLAAHCVTIMLATTMGFGELRHLRRRDVDMNRRCVTIRDGAKNKYRGRTIPLSASAYESMSWILDRWAKLGGTSGTEFILPHRPRKQGEPWIMDEPMTAIRTAFEKIRKEAGLEHFRLYDCRVQAITKLLSNPNVSTQVAREIAGHISQAMQDRYSIQQYSTKKAALDALEGVESQQPASATPAPHAEPAMPDAADVMRTLFRTLQIQYNVTPEQMTAALQSHIHESRNVSQPANVIGFRQRAKA